MPCCVGVELSRGRLSRGRGGVVRYQRRPDTDMRHHPRLLDRPSTPDHEPGEPLDSAGVGEIPAGRTEEPSADSVEGRTSDGEVSGRQAAGGGRRKAASGRLGFQYPDVFGRRRTRGGSAAAAGRRRVIAAGRINFRHRTAQAQGDNVISDLIDSGSGSLPEVSLNTVHRRMLRRGKYAPLYK